MDMLSGKLVSEVLLHILLHLVTKSQNFIQQHGELLILKLQVAIIIQKKTLHT